MSDFRRNAAFLGLRILIAVPFFIFFWIMVAGAEGGLSAAGQVIIGMILLVAAGIIIAPGLARLLGSWVGGVYHPQQKFDKPQPMYSKVEARIKEENYDDALQLLDEIIEEHIDEDEPYIRKIDLLLNRKKDKEGAESAYQQGCANIKNKKKLERLVKMYNAMQKWDGEKQKQIVKEAAAQPLNVDETPDEIDEAYSKIESDDEDDELEDLE